MPGFTPINAHAINTPPTEDDASSNAEARPAGQKTIKRRQPARKKIAASSTTDEVAADDNVTGFAQKRISGKGRKRRNQSGDEPESKRRKSGSVKTSMLTTKSGVGATATKDFVNSNEIEHTCDSSTESQTVSLSSKSKLDGFRFNSRSVADANTSGILPRPSIPAFTPETSMSSLQQSQTQTTMQTIKCSAGGSSLLYSSSTVPSSSINGVKTARPLVSSKQSRSNNVRVDPGSPVARPQLPTPAGSDSPIAPSDRPLRHSRRLMLRSDSGDFGEPIDEDDEDVIELTERIEKTLAHRNSPSARPRKLNIRDTYALDDYGGALLTEEERRILDAIKLPQDGRRPVVRTTFPTPIMDRSSLFGVSSLNALKTCFRVGEALNAGCQAVRNSRNLVIELYARITSSWREPKPSRKQHFVIDDLYHDRPPYINGTFELWDQSRLWDQDSRPFLNAGADGMLCRMIGRMKRDGTKWKLEILSIWQADWGDVDHVASIYAKQVNGDGSKEVVKE